MTYFYKYRFSQLYGNEDVRVLDQKAFDSIISKYENRPPKQKCVVDLSGCVLRDVVLCEKEYPADKEKLILRLDKTAMEKCILTEAMKYESFVMASVVDSFIEDADFDKTNFRTAYFENTDINNCYFDSCDFTDSYMRGSFLFETQLRQCDCESMMIEEMDFIATLMRRCDFRNSQFTGDLFKSCDIRENNFENIHAKRCDVDALCLTEHNPGFSNLTGCVYKVEPNTLRDAAYGDSFIQAYKRNENGNLGIGDILYVGSYERCSDIQRYLSYGTMREQGVKNMFEQEKFIRSQLIVPVYRGDTVPEGGEERQNYLTSLDENRKCESLIAKVCGEFNEGGNLDAGKASEKVINAFGNERVALLVASAIKASKSKDISEENRAWADSIDLPAAFTDGKGSLSGLDGGILDQFAAGVRESAVPDQGREEKPPELVPVYEGPSPYDTELSDEDLKRYKASQKASADCAVAIGEAINQHSDPEHSRIDVRAAYDDAARRFGHDRVKYVTVNTIKYYEYDGRISKENKDWAYKVKMPPHSDRNNQRITDRVHHIIIDAFADVVREKDLELSKQVQKEPNSLQSLLEDAKSTLKETRKHSKTKARDNSVQL